MNREQLGVLVVACTALVTLSLSASAVAELGGGSDAAMGGTSVFTEDATLKDDLNPESQNLSRSPFLEMLYELTPGTANETNTSNVSAGTGGGTSLLPVVMLFGGLFAVAGLLFLIWVWRLWSASRAGESTDEDGGETVLNGGAEDNPDRTDDFEFDTLGNEVYRAWYQIASRVDTNRRRSATSRELARYAVEEGLDPNAVETVTELFETARYGNATVTDEDERRAREAMARLGLEEEFS